MSQEGDSGGTSFPPIILITTLTRITQFFPTIPIIKTHPKSDTSILSTNQLQNDRICNLPLESNQGTEIARSTTKRGKLHHLRTSF